MLKHIIHIVIVASLIILSIGTYTAKNSQAQSIPIRHIIVIMEENHSFDNYFGTYPGANGLNESIALPLTKGGEPVVKPFHITSLKHDLCHSWTCAHEEYDGGKMDGFVYVSRSNMTMGYYDYRDIPYYWDYASQFVLLDNYFSSVMGPSFPNHLYLIAAQSGGITGRDFEANLTFPSIIDELEARGISWKYYAQPYLSGWNPLYLFDSIKKHPSWQRNIVQSYEFIDDVKAGKLPSISWIMPSSDEESEHPPFNITLGELRVVKIVNTIMESKYWNSSAIFITWDEYGGFYDHVPPPQVDQYGYGFRVPLLIISPYAKQGFIDHTLADHTSILKFIETVFSLPPLSSRDAAANDLMEAFDFSQPPRAPLILPGNYIPNHYPLTPISTQTITAISKSTSSDQTRLIDSSLSILIILAISLSLSLLRVLKKIRE